MRTAALQFRVVVEVDGFIPNDGQAGSYAGPEVLGLDRKRPRRNRSLILASVGGRFRYSDLKEAAGAADAMGFEWR
jgi:hypothetical protein